MPLISTVEAKSWRGRLYHVAILLALCLGGITIIYPFLIMLSGSVRSEMDQSDLDLIPRYWTDTTTLYQKFLETKYNQDIDALNNAYLSVYYSFREVPAVEGHFTKAAAAFRQFITQSNLPIHWRMLGGISGVRTVPEPLRELRRRLSDQFNGNLAAFGRSAGTIPANWNTIVLSPPRWTTRRYDYADDVIHRTYFGMLDEADPANVQYVSLTGVFLQSMIYPTYGRSSVAAYNAAHTVPLKHWRDFQLPAAVPAKDPQLRIEWTEFVRHEINPSFILFTGSPAAYHAFLQKTYQDDIAQFNKAWQSAFTHFDAIPLPAGQWLSGQPRQDYEQFLAEQPVEQLRLTGPEYAWHTWQRTRGQPPTPMPVAALEYDYVRSHTASLRWTYSVRNYINVFDELVFEGRAMFNTVVFCTLVIVGALLINPLAAYAMSRFKLPGTYKFLLILMATMAFPPMVTLIPQFILLRKAGLLNTFTALVQPLVTNGYLNFLLKGFFDSLPTELYEAASIDGASELRMFFQIAMALSKPILAVIALMTFNAAYTAFLYPLLVAPNPNMWLLSVWLYQYQLRSSSAGVYASVVITSLPTLAIFLFTQRTILRGIVIPTEK
jgi:multiple sugar transport system permease protein